MYQGRIAESCRGCRGRLETNRITVVIEILEGKRKKDKRTVCVRRCARMKQCWLHAFVTELHISRFESVGGIDGGSDLGSSVTKLENGFEKLLRTYSYEYYNTHKNSLIHKSVATCQSEFEKERGERSSGVNRAPLLGEVDWKPAIWGSHWVVWIGKLDRR